MSISISRRSSFALTGMIVLMVSACAARSFAQATVLRGLVTDEAKKPLAKVRIVLLDPERGTKFETKSGKKGEFMQVGIPPATYMVTLELAGYFPHDTKIHLTPGVEDKVIIVMKKIPERIDQDKEFAEAISLFQEGKYQEAVDIFLKVRERFPEYVEVYYNLGVAYLRLGRTDDAVAALEKAIELKADAVEPYLALGECQVGLGQNDKAMETFAKAESIAPANPLVQVSLGLVCYKADRIDDAIAHFDKAIQSDPKFSTAHYQAGLARLKKGDYPGAIKDFEAFLELEPNGPEATQVRTMIDELKKNVK
jgi:TolA-binding protein